jgi:hypothetical protein
MDAGDWTLWGLFALAGLSLWVAKLRRTAAFRALAARLGFSFCGHTIPSSLSFAGTPFQLMSSIWNVIDGKKDGVRIVAFDCRVGTGKASWRRTVIAAQSSSDVFGGIKFNPELTTVRANEWLLLYEPQRPVFAMRYLMPVVEVAAHIDSVRA